MKQRNLLANFNRVLILGLALAGLLMDGYQRSDILATLALLVWLWLAVCTRIEANILSRACRYCARTWCGGRRQRCANESPYTI